MTTEEAEDMEKEHGIKVGAKVYVGPADAELPDDGSLPDGFIELGFAPIGNVSVNGEKLGGETEQDDELDEFQRERVVALEEALRILESRKAPRDGAPGLMKAFAGTPGVPMVKPGAMLNLAAFIADGTELQKGDN